jgi:hypothetical protein
MVPFCQFFTSLEWVRAMEIIASRSLCCAAFFC